MNSPEILIINPTPLQLKTQKNHKLTTHTYPNDNNLNQLLQKHRPQLIITTGNINQHPNLNQAPYHIRKKWIHTPKPNQNLGDLAYNAYIHSNLTTKPNTPPLISIYTPTHNSTHLQRTYNSIKQQTYPDWEWVILNDSPNNQTHDHIQQITQNDYRIRLYKNQHSGRIGEVKKDTCSLCRGEILIELDHDDTLTPNALQWTHQAFQHHPQAGFLYTNFDDKHNNGTPLQYPNGWAFGYGKYKTKTKNGKTTHIAIAPNLNPKTIRHITSAPNHLRAWKTKTYHQIGGHNPNLHLADDYELIIRTFLHTPIIKLNKHCYTQYYGNNTHRTHNKEIQRLVQHITNHYEHQIHQKLKQHNINDYIHTHGWNQPNPPQEQHTNLTYP